MSRASFHVARAAEWADKGRVTLSQPREIAGFSTFADGSMRMDRTNLKRYRTPELAVDLLDGIESYTPKDESDPSIPPAPLGPLLEALEQVRPQLAAPPQFVTFRNNLNKILGTPYNTNNGWAMGVEKRDGCIYLDVRRSLDELERNKHPHANQIRGCYAGRRFETYATEPSAATSAPALVDEENEYCGLFAFILKGKRLVVGAELDCYDRVDARTDAPSYVELKTTRVLQTDKDRYVFERFKLLSFWIQSYIVGTPKIICGFRNDDFVLKKLQTFTTTDIPSFCRKYWDPRACLNFADALLDWLQEQAEDGRAYEVTYDPRRHQIDMIPLERGVTILPERTRKQ